MTQWGIDTLFNPAKRHMDEEKRRLQATRQQVGDTSGGKRIDLESGKVRIKPGAGADETAEADGAADGEDDARPGEAATDDAPETASEKRSEKRSAKRAEPKKELTPAQLRAAQRRGRAPH